MWITRVTHRPTRMHLPVEGDHAVAVQMMALSEAGLRSYTIPTLAPFGHLGVHLSFARLPGRWDRHRQWAAADPAAVPAEAH